MDTIGKWESPPVRATDRGAERRVGVELEFIGPSVLDAASMVRERFGGELEAGSQHLCEVRGSSLGDFTVKLDMKFAHRGADDAVIVDDDVDRFVRGLAGSIGSALLPIEIVCPPVALSEAPKLEALVEGLRERQASGAGDGLMAAYGAQFNPEAPSLSAESIRNHIQSFALLQQWLFAAVDVQFSRWLLAFAKLYPVRYCRRVLSEGYEPSASELIDDYLSDNPTRNRALDLLPLLRHVDEDRVVRALPAETINARPTYHYRLPNMNLADPAWSLGVEWSRWLKVEKLAADPDLLAEAAETWLRHDRALFRDRRSASFKLGATL